MVNTRLSKCKHCGETFPLRKEAGTYTMTCPKCDTYSTIIVGISDVIEFKVTQVKQVTKHVRVTREELKGWEPESPEAKQETVMGKANSDEVEEKYEETLLTRPITIETVNKEKLSVVDENELERGFFRLSHRYARCHEDGEIYEIVKFDRSHTLTRYYLRKVKHNE